MTCNRYTGALGSIITFVLVVIGKLKVSGFEVGVHLSESNAIMAPFLRFQLYIMC